MLSLAISLGHNSSVILLEDGEVKIGYEEERLSGVKADSEFPTQSLGEINKYYDLKKVETVSVSHWNTYGKIDDMSSKHWDRDMLTHFCPNAVLWSHDQTFTHHDGHMLSALKYSGLKGWSIVADGFGNFNEVLSIYYDGAIIHRSFGYEKSLGLLYQYATAFLGMKMNQDEYKLLGYEAYIGEILKDGKQEILGKYISSMIGKYTTKLLSRDVMPKYDALCNTHALPALRSKIATKLARVTRELQLETPRERRIAIAYLIQSVVEGVMTNIVNHYGMKTVTLAGGIFYNVKLNNKIMNCVDKISVCPLAGDQGAALGVYEFFHGDLKFPQDLCIGKRDLSGFKYRTGWDKLHVYNSDKQACAHIVEAIGDNKIVNIVRGDMEFGPRALGNTTTLFKPTAKNVEYVNHLNGRNTIMPCAPITTDVDMFEDHDKVVKSLQHMIITLDYDKRPTNTWRGAAHKYPFSNKFSGRPQLIDESHWLHKVVSKFRLLVNTSYNKHGSPILFSEDQIMETFNYQSERDNENRMVTIVVIDN